MVSGLLLLMVLAVLQLALVLHVRNTLVDSAAEGARAGALHGATPAEAVVRTEDLIRTSLAPRFADDVSAGVVTTGGAPLMQVTVRAPLPVVGLIGFGGQLEVQGHAVLEVAP